MNNPPSSAGSLTPLTGRSPAEEIPPLAGDEYPAEYFGPNDADELLPIPPKEIGSPPPMDLTGIEQIAELEKSKPEPDGWREYSGDMIRNAEAGAPRAPAYVSGVL